MTKQIKVIMISLVVTLIVLFGGYQGYQYFKIEKPIKDVIHAQKDISLTKIEADPEDTEVQLNVKPTYDFIDKFPEVSIQLDKNLGKGKWHITFTNPQSNKVEIAWHEMVFGVKEGLETGKYTLIQTTVKQISSKYHLHYQLYIDDQYVYLSLKDENKTWYQILPIKAVK
ncbi:hypothetical protein MK805_11240 [Shimazuella sp. AN120528]|uniref:hypothetical protein n=1 Tax=Shimazuella soli TaxID=1892854 RepID=UPI001F0FA82B|nr:hypothetical protein [Shimazuella soli]MCH5585524.1 hypothetical protein [Shimazuella soli]